MPGDRPQHIQRFWREGRDFLQTTLSDMKGDIPNTDAVVMVDCYGIDIFERLLVDVRGVYSRATPSPVPTLRRFQLSSMALSSGYAYPCPSFYCDENLAASFQLAVDEQRGAFGDPDEEFVHPVKCRRARYQYLMNRPRLRRQRYVE